MNKTSIRKNIILLYIHYLLVILWLALMFVIFWFSSQPADVSTEQSLTIGKFICKIVVSGYGEMTGITQRQYAELYDHFVRKSAHFCEYAVLGALTYNVAYLVFNYLKTRKKKDLRSIYLIISSLLWCILYASTDEIHQLFVEGRYGSSLDVILDAAGSLLGIMLVVLIRYLISKKYSPSPSEDI
ncbi:MAG: VanZ family protein [Lachnospiraceae bacterium]|nr:VanZ family protein [Lachnospiraceae bacterium]